VSKCYFDGGDRLYGETGTGFGPEGVDRLYRCTDTDFCAMIFLLKIIFFPLYKRAMLLYNSIMYINYIRRLKSCQ